MKDHSNIVVKRNTISLPPPHSREQEIYQTSLAPITACAWGTKAGKTFGSTEWQCKYAWENGGGDSMPHWWVAPIYKQAKIAMRLMRQFLPNDPSRIRFTKTEHRIEILKTNGDTHAAIEFRSADDPDALQGDAVKSVVVDEADRMKRDSWESLLTTITQTRAPARVISSPKRRAWFWELCRTGMNLTSEKRKRLHAGDSSVTPSGVFYMNCPTSINPYVQPEVIERMRTLLPERAFRCYYLAEFPESDGIVFRNIDNCFDDKIRFEENPNPNEKYIASLDLARHSDYCVLIIGSVQRRCIVNILRWRGSTWESSWRKALSYAEAYNNAEVIIDCTTYGDPILEQMQMADTPCHVEGYNWAGKSKGPLIDSLVLGIEKADIHIPKEKATDWCKEELEIYEFDISESGNVHYSAPEGQHDDFVASLAMWYWQLTHRLSPGIKVFDSTAISIREFDESEFGRMLQIEADKYSKLIEHEIRARLAIALGDD